MQKFNKKQIALAVSATLLAGSAMAAALTPLTGATKTVLATAVGGGATAADLYTNAGVTGAVNIAFLANAAVTFGAATTFNTGTDANDDVTVKAGGTNIPAAQLALATDVAGIGSGKNIVVTITPVAPAAVRINNTTGALEYTADKSAATPTWGAVTLQVNVVAGNAVTDNAVAIDAATAATTAFASSDFILPTTAKTFAAAGASLLTGVTVDFKHPVASPTKTTLQVWSKAVAPLANAEDITNSAKTGITVPTFTAVTGSTTAYVVALPDATKVDWDNSGTIDSKDADLVKYDSFNTGLAGASAPVELKVPATGPAYTNIFKKTTGQADTVATQTLSAADGAAPVLTGAEYQSAAGTLTLTFSEPVRTIENVNATFDDVREILENVKLNGVTLAADYQIREEYATVSVTNNKLTINRLGDDRTDVEGKAVALTSGLSLVEDAATLTLDGQGLHTTTTFNDNTVALDNTFSGSFVATLNNSVAFDDSSARAFYAANDLTKIAYIDVDFNKTLSLKAGKSLDKTLKVTFRTYTNWLEVGSNGPEAFFDWYPSGSEISIVGDTLRLTLPTNLLRDNLDDGSWIGRSTVTYTAGTDKPLEAAINASTKVDVSDATEEVILPLTASAANQGLYTMDVKATLTGAQAGSKVVGYLAKWVDKATAADVSMDIKSGKVTLPGDKWASDVVLALDTSVSNLESEINKQLKEAKPAAVTAWVVVTRSNDAVKGGSNAGVDGNQDSTENFLVATARLYGDFEDASDAASDGQAEKTAFEVTIDPKTGKISGRLTGQLVLKNQNTNANERGLVFIKPDGKLSNSAGAAAQSQALVDGTGKARFLIGADPKADLKGAGDIFKDAFVLVVHESQDADGNSSYALVTSAEPSMSNFLPFSANIVAGNDAVGSLNLTLANNVKRYHGTTSWQLIGAGNLDRKTGATAAINMPRLLVGLSGSQPYSFWTNDGNAADGSDYKDMALTMLGNKAGVAVEAKDKDTVTVADKANTKANAFAFAFADDNNVSGHLFFATKAAEAPALPVGWSLIAQPAAAATSALTDATMVLTGNEDNVGIGGSWVTGDAAKDLSAGQPIFIYQKKAAAGK
jgi:hypothetical protein